MQTEKKEVQKPKEQQILLRLYIIGMTPAAQKAFRNLEKLCEEYFPEKYHIELIDLKEQPELASEKQIFAVPTVVRELPPPIRKVIGDLSDSEKVLIGLQLSSFK